MRPHIILRYNGLVLLFNAVFMFIAFCISLHFRDAGTFPLLLSTILTTLIGIFPIVFVPKAFDLSNKEAYLIVVSSWLLSCLFGMLPFLLYGKEFSVINAWFESVSGYTTTGATILSDVESLPKGLMFWRSSTHWLGGIGVVLFVLIVIPTLGKAKMALSRVELSALAKDNFHNKTRNILYIILYVYLGLTLLQTVLLYVFGMSLFDAVNHSFATIATGGFSTKNTSIAHYNSIAIETIITVFMFFAGIHFGMLFNTITFKKRNCFNSQIVRYYTFSIILVAILISVDLLGKIYTNWGESFRHSIFQVVSLATTTGFATTDTAIWPTLSIILLILISFQCACSGSTGGGIKADRVFVFIKMLRRQTIQLQHPQAVVPVKVNNHIVDDDILGSILLFIVFYIVIVVVSTVLLAIFGQDLMTAFSASLASVSNIGPGFGKVGSMANYFEIDGASKLILSVGMLLGRLEIYGLLLLFMFHSWK